MSGRRIFDIIVSILAGFAIWAYVVSVQDPVTTDTFKSIPVQLVNTEAMANAGMAIAGSGDYTVDVVVSGNRSALNSVTSLDFAATADVSQLTAVGQNYINVEVSAPATLTISEIRTQKIQVYVDKLVSVDKAICIVPTNLEDGFELGSVSKSAETVTVSGAESLVNTVSEVRANMDMKERTQDDSVAENYKLIPVDSSGNRVYGVKLSQDTVNIVSSMFATKEVALNVSVDGTLNEHLAIRSEIIPASITIRGPQATIDSIWVIYSEPIDISTITESCSIPLRIYLYDGVEIADASKDLCVSYELKDRADTSFSYEYEDIVFVNAPEGLEISTFAAIELSFSVFDDEIENFAKEDVTLSVDLTDLIEGQYQLPITMTVAEEFTDVLVTGLPETIDLTLSLPQSEEEILPGPGTD